MPGWLIMAEAFTAIQTKEAAFLLGFCSLSIAFSVVQW